MSGPTTVIVTGNPAVVLLAASAIRAAQAVLQAHDQAQALKDEQQVQGRLRQQRLRDATEQGQAAVQGAVAQAQGRFEQLSALAQRLGLSEQVHATRPAPPAVGDSAAAGAYVSALQQLNEELQSILLTEAARQQQEPALGPDFSAASAAAAAREQTLSQRLLSRLAHLEAVPEPMHQLARALDQCPPGARAQLLATELRAQIQAHAQALQQQQLQQATALVLEHSLKELGYQVQELSHTLFVEGGVVHFRRSGWGRYMVRMRIDAHAGSANFNVVRAVAQGDNEASVLDHLAEDRWCAEFPALLKALQARGLDLTVTRRLQAGEVPVQCVAEGQLPAFADDEAASTPTQAQELRRT